MLPMLMVVCVPRSVGSTMLMPYGFVTESLSMPGSLNVCVLRMCSFSASISASLAWVAHEGWSAGSTDPHARGVHDSTHAPQSRPGIA